MIVATPLFSALKTQGNVEHIVVMCSPANEVVVKHNPFIDRLITVNFHSVISVAYWILWIRRNRFDAIIDLTPGFSRTNYLISMLSGSKVVRAGIEKAQCSNRYHVNITQSGTPIADRMLNVGEAVLGTKFIPPHRLQLHFPDPHRTDAARIADAYKKPLVAINLSAGASSRQPGADQITGLIRHLREANTNATILLIAMERERETAAVLARENNGCIPLPQLPLFTIAALLEHCSVLVTPDTALVHVAAAMGAPVVGLYTAAHENMIRWKPYNVAHRVVVSGKTDSIGEISSATIGANVLELMRFAGTAE